MKAVSTLWLNLFPSVNFFRDIVVTIIVVVYTWLNFNAPVIGPGNCYLHLFGN